MRRMGCKRLCFFKKTITDNERFYDFKNNTDNTIKIILLLPLVLFTYDTVDNC